MKIKLDLSKFKLVKKDDKIAHLKHPDGHEFRVAINALHPMNRKHLDTIEPLNPKMADGGEVEQKDKGPAIDQQKAKEIQDSANQSGWQPETWKKNLKDGLGLAKGGAVPMMAEGGNPEDNNKPISININATPQMPANIPQIDSQGNIVGNTIGNGGNIPGNEQPQQDQSGNQPFTVGGSMGDQPFTMGGASSTQPESKDIPDPDRTPAADDKKGEAEDSGSGANRTEPLSQAPAGMVDSSSPTSPAQPGTTTNQVGQVPSPSLTGAYVQAMQSADQMGKINSAAAKDSAAALKKNIADTATAAKVIDDRIQAHLQESDDLYKDVKDGHIDPNRFLGSMSTWGKLSTGLGLILGGLGSSATGGQNQALEFLNRQIDRDIEAQKANLGKKQTLYSYALEKLKDDRQAGLYVRSTMQSLLDKKLNEIAARSKSPMAIQQAQMIQSGLQSQYFPGFRQQAMMELINQNEQAAPGQDHTPQILGVLRQTNPEMAKEMESRYVPGVGMAHIPVPAEDRRNLVAKQTLHNMATDFATWAKDHSGSLSPSDIATGKTKAAELQSLYRNAINGGVFKKGEQEFIDQIIDSDPTKFFNSIRVLPKIQEVIRSNQNQLNTLKKSFDLPTSTGLEHLPPQHQKWAKWAMENPQNEKSPHVLKKLGLQ